VSDWVRLDPRKEKARGAEETAKRFKSNVNRVCLCAAACKQ
jgi:hypothetical protein